MAQLLKKFAIVIFCLEASLAGNSQSPSFSEIAANKTQVGKIMFSNQPFTTSNSGSKNSFSSADFIYARLETDGRKLVDVLKVPQKRNEYEKFYLLYFLHVYKNGQHLGRNVGSYFWVLKNVSLDGTSLNFDVCPGPQSVSTEMSFDGPGNYGRTPSTVAPLRALIGPDIFSESGVYKIKVEVFDITGDEWGRTEPVAKWPSFTGEFDYTFNTSDIAKIKNDAIAVDKVFKARMDQQQQGEQNKRADEVRLARFNSEMPPAGWKLTTNALDGGMTIDQIKKQFNANTSGVTILKIYATASDGWKISKNRFGIPESKYLDQEVRVFYKISADSCGCKSIYLKQPYAGGGTYGKAQLDVLSGSPFRCDKLN